MIKNKILAIVGPTAVGKTTLTLNLAQHLHSQIISCDSVQIYEDCNIGSAKPTRAELDLVPHHLISKYPPSQRINVAVYKKDAEGIIQTLGNLNIIPIVSGGTGMYFNSLYYGLFSQKSQDRQFRQELELQVEAGGLDKLFEKLCSLDPAAGNNIKARDKVRIIRALEVLHCTGRSIFELQEQNERLDLDWYIIGLNRDRAELYRRIEERVDIMLQQGLISETKTIIEKYGRDAYALGSIGYRHVCQYLNGEFDYDTMVETLKKDTRHYAKRQLTWFHKNKDIHWYHPDDISPVIKAAEEFLL